MAQLMVRSRTTPDPAGGAIRDEIRMRELDRSNRRALDVLGESNLGARHCWAGGGNIVANTPVTLTAGGHWPVVRDDGLAQFVPASDFDVPGFYLNRPGRWALVLAVSSSAGFAGTMRVELNHPTPGDIFDGAGALRDTQSRNVGYPGAGGLDQLISWSGPVSAEEAVNPLTVSLTHLAAAGSTVVPTTWRLQANYLGSVTSAPAPIPPVEGIPQDDPVTVPGTEPASPAPTGWSFFLDTSRYQFDRSDPLVLSTAYELGYRGCVAKIGQGASTGSGFGQTIDPYWSSTRDTARPLWPNTFAGYWYCGDTETPASQAARCKAALGDLTIPVALDWEAGGGSYANLQAIVAAFRSAGIKLTVLYTGSGYANANGAANIDGLGLNLWRSRYYHNNPGNPRALFDEVPDPTGFYLGAFGGGTPKMSQFTQAGVIYPGMTMDVDAIPGDTAYLAAVLNGTA